MVLMLGFLFVTTSTSFGARQDEQFGKVKGTNVVTQGEAGPVKENICKNPKLCESLEIDLLDSLQKSKIPAVVPKAKAAKSEAGYQVALNLGAVVSDGLAAVIGKNKGAVLKIAAILNKDGKKLGISQDILTKYHKEITALAHKGEWTKLETTLYEFKDKMTTELNDQNKKDEASLAMVSGSLEGLYILVKSVDKKFSQEGANLLQDKAMGPYLEKYMNSLSEAVKDKSEVKAITAALPKIDNIIDKPKNYDFTKKDLKDLLAILKPLHKGM